MQCISVPACSTVTLLRYVVHSYLYSDFPLTKDLCSNFWDRIRPSVLRKRPYIEETRMALRAMCFLTYSTAKLSEYCQVVIELKKRGCCPLVLNKHCSIDQLICWNLGDVKRKYVIITPVIWRMFSDNRLKPTWICNNYTCNMENVLG